MPDCRATPDSGSQPTMPSGLVANGTDSSVVLSWDANAVSEGVTSYKVYRSVNRGGPFTLLDGSVEETTYEDTTASTGVLYWYRVSAVNPTGEGGYSDVLGSFQADLVAPSDPTITSTTLVGATAVKLTWTSPTDDDLAGFNIYARISPAAYVKKNSSLVAVLEFTHEAATAGNTWDYKVTSVDLAGNESTGSTSSIAVPASDTTAPAVPSTPVCQNTSTGLLLSWTPNTEVDLASYKIYRSDDSYTAAIANPSASLGGTYLDTTAVVGQTYSYKVLARDTTGNESAKSTASNAVERTNSTTGSLAGFIRVGQMVPTVVHARGVPNHTYNSVSTTTTSTVTFNEDDDFPALSAGTYLTAKYDWNFAAGATNPQGAYPQLRGWNGAHALDSAGTYTVKLTRTDEAGKVEIFQSDVTVAADTRTVVYCKSDGLGTGSGSTQATAVNLARANQILSTTPNVKVLLRYGDSFWFGSSGGLRLKQVNQMLSAISSWTLGDSQALPKIGYNAAGNVRNLIYVESGATNFVIEKLDFTCQFSNGNLKQDYAIRVFGSTNGLIRDNKITKFGSFVECSDTKNVRYLLLQNNQTVGGNKALKNSIIYIKADDVVVLGCTLPNSRDEHPIRWGPSCRTLVAFCNLKNMQYNASASPWKDLDTTDTVKTVVDIQQGFFHYLYGNTLTADLYAPTQAGTCQIGPLNETTGHVAEFVKHVCLERNTITASVDIQPGCSDVIIRNNLITKDGGDCFEIDSVGSGTDSLGQSYSSRKAQRVYLLNNTCFCNSTSGQLLRMKDVGQTLVVLNNLFIGASLQPGGSADTQTACARLGNTDTTNTTNQRNFYPAFDKFLVGSSNTFESVTNWNKRANFSDNLVGSIVLNSLYKVPTASPAKTLARPVAGVFEDFYGTSRSQQAPSWVVGAVEGSY